MSKRNRRSSTKAKRPIGEQFVVIRYSLINSTLFQYLEPFDLIVYILIASKKNGDDEHDSRLVLTNTEASKYMSSATFSKAKLHLWAYRLIEITNWGRTNRRPTTFKLSMKWRTLIEMPYKLDRIRTLLIRHQRVMKFIPSKQSKRRAVQRSKEEIKTKKRELTLEIKRRISEEPL